MPEHDPLDDSLRQWARDEIAATPVPELPAETRHDRRPRRLGAMLAVAAVVVLLAVGIPVWNGLRPAPADGTNGPATGSAPSITTSSTYRVPTVPGLDESTPSGSTGSTPSTPTSNDPTPTGLQTMTVNGLSVQVPSDWPVGATRCGTPTENTVTRMPDGLACLMQRAPGISSVMFHRQLWEGVTAPIAIPGDTPVTGVKIEQSTADLYSISVVVPALDIAVLIEAPTKVEAQTIAATLRQTNIDENGCATTDSYDETRPEGGGRVAGSGTSLAPGAPTEIVACRYYRGHLGQGATVTGTDMTDLLAALNSLPAGLSVANPADYAVGLCPEDTRPGKRIVRDPSDEYSDYYRLRLRYPEGDELLIDARLGMCGLLGASNGSVTGQRDDALQKALWSVVGSSTGMPGRVLPYSGNEPSDAGSTTTSRPPTSTSSPSTTG
ncbi:hypothetical protein GIS00_23075 [Nakamurella sp. YIM 132087]|uniref:Uncharacterized protein n=1 Tax=Nakamurella alba TaxID=2665158 RepID=A0A7K1FRX3_9ACTN|nr:hypothetical protein [Nakamurella alba]MTD16820.1 hypothetical protein [Nakamurella alba]